MLHLCFKLVCFVFEKIVSRSSQDEKTKLSGTQYIPISKQKNYIHIWLFIFPLCVYTNIALVTKVKY